MKRKAKAIIDVSASWAGWLSKRAEELERRKSPQWLAVAKIAAQARKKAGVKS